MLNVITSTYIMKLINFINLFYFQEEIIFLNLCWIRIRFSNFFQVLLGSGLRWAGSTSVRWTLANISNRWLYCTVDALSLTKFPYCVRLFAAFLDHGPQFVLRLVIVVLNGIAHNGVYHRGTDTGYCYVLYSE